MCRPVRISTYWGIRIGNNSRNTAAVQKSLETVQNFLENDQFFEDAEDARNLSKVYERLREHDEIGLSPRTILMERTKIMNMTYNQHAIQKTSLALAALVTGIMTVLSLTVIVSNAHADTKALSTDMSCDDICAKLQLIFSPRRSDDGDDSVQRFWKPKWQGVRLDARMHIDARYDHPFVAHEYCNERGYRKASSYRVATRRSTIGGGDRNIFTNGKRSTPAFRYVTCNR